MAAAATAFVHLPQKQQSDLFWSVLGPTSIILWSYVLNVQKIFCYVCCHHLPPITFRTSIHPPRNQNVFSLLLQLVFKSKRKKMTFTIHNTYALFLRLSHLPLRAFGSFPLFILRASSVSSFDYSRLKKRVLCPYYYSRGLPTHEHIYPRQCDLVLAMDPSCVECKCHH
jgi:hypothetical protein